MGERVAVMVIMARELIERGAYFCIPPLIADIVVVGGRSLV